MPHERDVLKPRVHVAHIRLIGSELLGLERDHSGVISAWFEHDQILAGTECIGVGSHRFDGHTGLTDFLTNLVAGADLPGIDGLVAGQSDLDAIGAGEYGGGAAVGTAVGDVGPGVIEVAPLKGGVAAQIEDAGDRLFASGQQVLVNSHVSVAVQLEAAWFVVGGDGRASGMLAVGKPRVNAERPRCLHGVVVVHGEGLRKAVLVQRVGGGDGDVERVSGDVGGAP